MANCITGTCIDEFMIFGGGIVEMELILQGWITYDEDENVRLSRMRGLTGKSISELIMEYFNYVYIDDGLGKKMTVIHNAHLQCWFSDEQCTLEEAQTNFESYMLTGELITHGYYIGYSEWTITGFIVSDLKIGGHDLVQELKDHEGQYIHFILSD